MTALLLDRRKAYTSGTFDGTYTIWPLPTSVATDGSEGTVEVVQTNDGTVLTAIREFAASVKVLGNYSSTPVTIGLQYEFRGQLSTIYLRNADYTGIPRADSRKRLQLQRVRFLHEDTYKYDVLVQGSERSEATYSFSSSTPDSGDHKAPVLSNNELVTIKIKSLYPLPVWITGMEWEGQFRARVGLR